MDKLNKISKQLEETFNKIQETIDNIVNAEKLINELTKTSEKYNDTLNDLKNDDRLIKISKQNNETANNIRKNITNISTNLEEIEIYRTVFEDNVISYNTKIENFAKSFDEKAKMSSQTEQTLLRIIKILAETEKKQASNRKQLTEIATGIDFIKRFKEVEIEQKNINNKLDLIYNALTGKNFELNDNIKVENSNTNNNINKNITMKNNQQDKNSFFLSSKNKVRISNILKSDVLTVNEKAMFSEFDNLTYYKNLKITNVNTELLIPSEEINNVEFDYGLLYISSKNQLPKDFINDINKKVSEQIKSELELVNVVDNRNQSEFLIINVILYKSNDLTF